MTSWPMTPPMAAPPTNRAHRTPTGKDRATNGSYPRAHGCSTVLPRHPRAAPQNEERHQGKETHASVRCVAHAKPISFLCGFANLGGEGHLTGSACKHRSGQAPGSYQAPWMNRPRCQCGRGFCAHHERRTHLAPAKRTCRCANTQTCRTSGPMRKDTIRTQPRTALFLHPPTSGADCHCGACRRPGVLWIHAPRPRP